MTCSTVEERIYRKQVFKGGLFKSVTEHKEQIRYFSQQDLRDLFSLPKQGFDISLTQQQLLEEHGQQYTMEESVKAHIEFLENLNIAGVSQHSLLFSKTAPVPDVQIEEEVRRVRGNTFMGNSSSRSSHEYNVDGADYAFKPKDVQKFQKNFAPAASEPSETGIADRIRRLSQMLINKVAVSKLPDKGEKIHKQIAELRLQLDQLRMAKGTKDKIDLDTITTGFQRVWTAENRSIERRLNLLSLQGWLISSKTFGKHMSLNAMAYVECAIERQTSLSNLSVYRPGERALMGPKLFSATQLGPAQTQPV
ncbi:Protein CHROMATIN REMODELING 24 [Abeliophyllum distichum]|uniref:Protein CHROMATIN REMODELING 24 n=1 Tax=Abeliophyllum distichum TaxID=126358 RepID=A0ABD1TZB1_9LAMI